MDADGGNDDGEVFFLYVCKKRGEMMASYVGGF